MSSRVNKVYVATNNIAVQCCLDTTAVTYQEEITRCLAQRRLYRFLDMQGTTRRFSKGLDEASTARSGLRSTEKILANQRTASMQLKLDDELQLLVRLHNCIVDCAMCCTSISAELCTLRHANATILC